MIYITGDTHGDISCFKNPKLNKLGEKIFLLFAAISALFGIRTTKTRKKILSF